MSIEAEKARARRGWMILGSLGVAGFVAAVARHDSNGLFGALTAAWVQAFGSIAAVVGAAAIALHQSAEQRRAAEAAAKAAATDRALDHNALIDAAQHVLMRAEKTYTLVITAMKDQTLDDWARFVGSYQLWCQNAAAFAADLRLLATKADHGWLVAELMRAAAVICQDPIENLARDERLLATLRDLVIQTNSNIRLLVADFEELRRG